MMRHAFLALTLLLAATSCRPDRPRASGRMDSSELAGRASRLDQLRSDSVTDRAAPLARWVLPDDLAEVSGLALTDDGRLLTHDDELGKVSEIDYRTGVVVKQFVLGRRGVQADFEGIAAVGRDLFLVTSGGKIYEFHEGSNGGHVEYSVHDPELGKECEFEGLAYDPAIASLLLLCKNAGQKKLKDHLVVYRWKIDAGNSRRLSRMTVPLSSLIEGHGWEDLHPSGIEVDPTSGNYVIVAAQEKALIILSPEGRPVSVRALPAGHDQAEGVTITRDSILIICDEAVNRPAAITLYRWP
jgi:uncharacterized protein YjiK